GANAPEVVHTTLKGSTKKLKWSDVDMELVRDQMEAASAIARTPAARFDMAMSLSESGLVDQEEARRLISNPDIGKSLSVYTSAIESIERQIEEGLDGEIFMPTSYS